MASVTSTPNYEAALAGLARTIRKRRSDCPPHETARQLLEYDRPGHVGLVGVRYDAGRARLAALAAWRMSAERPLPELGCEGRPLPPSGVLIFTQ